MKQNHIKESSPLETMKLYLIPPILSVAGNLILGIYLNMKNPRSKVTYAFTVMVMLLVGWALAEIMMRIQTSPERALFWSKIFYLNGFFLPSAFLVLSYVYTGGRKSLYIAVSYVLGMIFIPFLFSNDFVEKVEIVPSWGYDVQVGSLFLVFSVLYIAVIGIGAFILLQYYKKSSFQEQRRLQFMMVGFIIAVVLIGVTNLLSRIVEISLPRAGSMFSLVATISFAYGMVKYQLMVVPTREKPRGTVDSRCGALCSLCSAYLDGLCPSCELGDPVLRESCPIYRCSVEKGVVCNDCSSLFKCDIYRAYAEHCPFSVDRYGLKTRTSYLWEDRDPQFAFEVFKDYTLRGIFGLLITRDYPQKVVEKYHLPDVTVLWLSQIEKEGTSIEPTNLPRLTHTITEYIKQAPVSFILLVGLEYLIVHNGFDKVLKHLHMVNDQVMTHNARLVVVVDPKALDPKELSLLEREMRPLRKDNLFKVPG